MSQIKIITDSTCDLTEDLIKHHEIEVVPLFVNFGESSYQDGIDLNTEAMYKKVTDTNMIPKTSAASPAMFQEVFERYLEEGYEIIYTGIGQKFSATLQNATIAKNAIDSDKIHLVDSENLSSGSGLLVLRAVKMRDEGMSAQEIVGALETLRTRVQTRFIIDTLEYLHKGGRLKAISAFVGTMLKVHPIIRVVDGEMTIGKKPRGKLRNGIKILLNDVLKDEGNIDTDFVMITHSQAHEHVDFIREQLAHLGIKNIYETEAGCVISSHCGAGTIGVLYITKS